MIFLKIIGLCGGSGSGKGEVCCAFRALGVPTIDTDSVYHELTSHASECLRELIEAFGDDIIKDGILDRRALASLVFGAQDSAEKCDRLNKITHKHVLQEVRRRLILLREENNVAAVVDAPLLFESGFNSECDFIIAVIADAELRIQRIVARDNITVEHAAFRIRAQKSDDWLREHANFVITNNGGISELSRQVEKAYEMIINL